ncbi:MAG: hypothetical protein M3Q58_17255 [Bacteroidota bacterium]|nr:hypothetical protein [Bacteroidota bacterium]
MTTNQVIDNISKLTALLDQVNNSFNHVGVALQAMEIVKEYEVAKDKAAANNLYNNAFYSYFQQASNDMHSQFPLRKLALLDALEAYKRHLSWKNGPLKKISKV